MAKFANLRQLAARPSCRSGKDFRIIFPYTSNAVFISYTLDVSSFTEPANSKFDVVFLLDSSNSVGKRSFEAAKRFAINLLNYFSVFPAKTRIAAATYNGNVSLQFDFKKYVNKECVEKRLRAIK